MAGAPKGPANGNYKKQVIWEGELHSLTEMVQGRELNAGTLRSRLYRNAQRKYINGQACFVCEEKYLRPQGKQGKSRIIVDNSLPFQVGRYSVSVDGPKEQLALNKYNQDWLSKPIRANYDQI